MPSQNSPTGPSGTEQLAPETPISAQEQGDRKPLRLWPGIAIVVAMGIIRFGLPVIAPESLAIAVLSGLAGGLLVIVWWLFFSRAAWVDRLLALGLIVLGLMVTPFILHPSIATGMMSMMFPIFAIPLVGCALVIWAVLSRNFTNPLRRITMTVAILGACTFWALLRTGGIDGSGDSDFAWRWSTTAEDRLLAQDESEGGKAVSATSLAGSQVDWPGFRGPDRNSRVPASNLASDWETTPPVELWRRQVGPGWSSFAVSGNFLYTQEQRGEEELVACYHTASGEPVWQHRDSARFWESNAGAGPRGTPTLFEGRLYTFGGTGILNVLNAADGSVVWTRNVATDTERDVPEWGFSSSPLIVDDLVLVAASGSLAAYDRASGEPRWLGPKGAVSYSSPHLLTLAGEPQILLLDGDGLASFAPNDGHILWQHEWSGYPIIQPALTPDGGLLISVSDRSGLRRLDVTKPADTWQVQERWTSKRFKPYFNDFVIHKGHVFGFDGRFLGCISLEDGERKWKGGRYGRGQMVLLAEQDLLLIISERGDLALVSATTDQYTELARVPAIEGKTWNHPVLVKDLLLVRNAEEMAAFRLPSQAGSEARLAP